MSYSTAYQIVKEVAFKEHGSPKTVDFELVCEKGDVYSDSCEIGLLPIYTDRGDAEKKLSEFSNKISNYRIVEMKLV